MNQRYYSTKVDESQAKPAGRPWLWMLVIGCVFYVAHPHHFDESVQFNYQTRGGDGSERDRADTNASAVAGGSPERRVSLSILLFASLVSFATFRDGGNLRLNGLLGLVGVAFLGVMLCSPAWAADPSLAVRRVVAVAILVLGALAVARRFSMEDLLLMTVLVTGSFLVIGVLGEIWYGTFRPWVSRYRFGGTLHPNRQGMNCAMLAMSAWAYGTMVPQVRRYFWVAAAIAVGFLVLTGSRTSLASASVAFLVFSFLCFSSTETLRYAAIAITLGAVLLGIGALVAGDRLDEKVSSTLLLGRDAEANSAGLGSLTGRVPLWEELTYHLDERPWLGFGYKSFWTPQRILAVSDHQGWSIMQAHNGYLEMALNVGIIGATLFTMIILLSLRSALSLFGDTNRIAAAFAAAAICWLITNTFLESWIDEPLLPSFISLTLIASLAALENPLWCREHAPEASEEVRPLRALSPLGTQIAT